MVVTLPVGAGPAYILLSFDHGAAFIADSTVASLAAHAATGSSAWPTSSRRNGILRGTIAITSDLVRLRVRHPIGHWSVTGAILVYVARYAICIVLVGRFLHVAVPPFASRWLDIPLRALLVASLVGTVVLLGANAGPKLTGIFAVFPIVMLSLMLILHPRIGGPATAAIIANTMWGLVGFARASSPCTWLPCRSARRPALPSRSPCLRSRNMRDLHGPAARACGAHRGPQARGLAKSLRE